jgi:hypothetical protein
MGYGFNAKRDGTEQAAPVQKQEYKICRGMWNARKHKHDGCGKLFTTDSFASECPECGTTLSHIRLSSPPEKGAARIILERCEKCAYNLYAQKCLGDKPTKPEYCVPCKCRECCREQSGLANAVIKGEYTLREWTRDIIRKREEKKAKAEEAERKAQAERGAVFVETGNTEVKKKPMAKLMEQAAAVNLTAGGDETPLF